MAIAPIVAQIFDFIVLPSVEARLLAIEARVEAAETGIGRPILSAPALRAVILFGIPDRRGRRILACLLALFLRAPK